MELVAITTEGVSSDAIGGPTELVTEVSQGMARLYQQAGYLPPWIGYLAVEDGAFVGTCAFKSPPAAGRVEIAYFTFPGNEGRGVATAMAQRLVDLARNTDPSVRVFAQTLPGVSASTRVLEKLAFKHTETIEHPEDGTVWEWEPDVK